MIRRAGSALPHVPSGNEMKICIAIRKRPTNSKEVCCYSSPGDHVRQGGVHDNIVRRFRRGKVASVGGSNEALLQLEIARESPT